MKRKVLDSRVIESGSESRERFLRCLSADIAWWRENASVIPDLKMKHAALEIAVELERVLDHFREKLT